VDKGLGGETNGETAVERAKRSSAECADFTQSRQAAKGMGLMGGMGFMGVLEKNYDAVIRGFRRSDAAFFDLAECGVVGKQTAKYANGAGVLDTIQRMARMGRHEKNFEAKTGEVTRRYPNISEGLGCVKYFLVGFGRIRLDLVCWVEEKADLAVGQGRWPCLPPLLKAPGRKNQVGGRHYKTSFSVGGRETPPADAMFLASGQ
jgi:hypothetical protein